jgi:hypothetical protein
MIIIEANDEASAHKINNHIDNGDDVFMLIYMEGCGPCNAVRPEWKELHSALGQQYAKNNKLVIVDVNKDYAHIIKKIEQPSGFPTILYVSKRGDKIENFEDAPIVNKTRSTDSFINWIESNITKMDVSPGSRTVHDSPHTKSRAGQNRTHRKTKGGKNIKTRTTKNRRTRIRKNRRTINKHRK